MLASKDQLLPYVAKFSSYVNDVEAFLAAYVREDKHCLTTDDIPAILNGEATKALNSIIPAKIRKKKGVFFTGQQLSKRVAKRLRPLIQSGHSIIDPACGVGNLLMSCAKYLPTGETLEDTLKIWSNRLFGNDLYYQFTRAARLRLILLAATIHKKENIPLSLSSADKVLTGIQTGNAFTHSNQTTESSCVVVNPPFGHMIAPNDCHWAKGKVQTAGVFIENLLKKAPHYSNIVAILPDVLRSGSRYHKWRKMVAGLCCSIDVELAGRFDDQTDVDVFILHLITGSSDKNISEWPIAPVNSTNTQFTLSDLFDIHVGPVVPYRDPKKGTWKFYVDCSTAKPWEIISSLTKRRFRGTSFTPPLVIIRRTSNPADKYRAVASIVNSSPPIAVENHLIVLKPKDNTLTKCKALMRRLKDDRTNRWLNNRIRCRHLTVSAVKEIPWWNL